MPIVSQTDPLNWRHSREWPPDPRATPGIDLLRAISILLVLLNHIGIRIRLTDGVLAGVLPKQALTDLTFNGSEGVIDLLRDTRFPDRDQQHATMGKPRAPSMCALSTCGARRASFRALWRWWRFFQRSTWRTCPDYVIQTARSR